MHLSSQNTDKLTGRGLEIAMSAITNEREADNARRAAQLHLYDRDLPGANWRPAFGLLALACDQIHRDWRPQLPEDSAELEPGFITRVRALASRI